MLSHSRLLPVSNLYNAENGGPNFLAEELRDMFVLYRVRNRCGGQRLAFTGGASIVAICRGRRAGSGDYLSYDDPRTPAPQSAGRGLIGGWKLLTSLI